MRLTLIAEKQNLFVCWVINIFLLKIVLRFTIVHIRRGFHASTLNTNVNEEFDYMSIGFNI